jgi:cytochrome P450
MPTASGAPITRVNIFDPTGDPALLSELRESGPAVFVEEHGFWVLTRYDAVRAAALDWQTYSSAEGVALLDASNDAIRGAIIATDPPEHDVIRGVLASQTAPRAIAKLRDRVAEDVDAITAEVVRRGSFDGITDLARAIPARIVGDLIGIPEEPRDHLFAGADAVNRTFGPEDASLEADMPKVFSFLGWIASISNRSSLRPGSWGAAVLDAVDAGVLTERSAQLQLNALLVAGLDTTANALGALLRVMAEQPSLWEALKADPALSAPVFEETLRLWSPVRGFFRCTTRDVQVGDADIPAGSRVFLHFQSANRDERHYPDPDVFNLTRNPVDHLSFGYGAHGCVGQAVARMEAHSVIASLLRRVDRFELTGAPEQREHPLINGLARLPLRAHLNA